MSVYFLRKSFEWASEILRTIFVHPSGLLRGCFETSRRIPEAASRILEETSKDVRGKYEGCTEDSRRTALS
jgi:hypothetical protein